MEVAHQEVDELGNAGESEHDASGGEELVSAEEPALVAGGVEPPGFGKGVLREKRRDVDVRKGRLAASDSWR